MDIRKASKTDVAAITRIYNEAIERTAATFDTAPKTEVEQGDWLQEHGTRYPVLVAELDGSVVGFASLSQYSTRCAYSDTAELSVYVLEAHQGRGIGRALMEAVIDAGREAGLHAIIARITEGNDASVHLHESLGFEHVGVMREVGRKFGKLLDVRLMELIYQ